MKKLPACARRLVFREVDRRRWGELEKLFQAPGGPKYCWCMAWRPMLLESRLADGRRRKAALRERVRQGVPIGILAYLNGEPVAWASIAPRPTYRRLGGMEDQTDAPEKVWSLVCFFVARQHRGQGLMPRLIEAAVAYARRRGAMVVEAYPVDPDSPSYRFMGFVPVFKAAGFREVARAGTRRHVMRMRV